MKATPPPHPSLYKLELCGDSRARGLQHGQELRQPIQHAVEFYRQFFAKHLGIATKEIRRRANRFIEPTARTSPLLMCEYEGIAEGSVQALEDIFTLSGRYEITYEKLKLGECSNVFVGPQRSANGHTLLGMNWEWRPEVMDFRAAITARCDDMPDHIVVTECGQPGKYGLNAHGLAAIETGLGCSRNTSIGDNLFAVVIRQALAQTTLEQARRVVHDHPPEATISFFIADESGRGLNLEASPAGIAERKFGPDEISHHTNHCLLTNEPCAFQDSFIRAARWAEMTRAANRVTRQQIGRWLADRKNGANAICKLPDSAPAHAATRLQTLCSIVLDPRARALWVSDGPSSENAYARMDFKPTRKPKGTKAKRPSHE